MNDPSVKTGYGKVAASLLVATVFFSMTFVFLYIFLTIALIVIYDGLFPFLDSRSGGLIILAHFFLLLIVIFFTLGIVSAWVYSTYIPGRRAIVLIGAASGFLANVLPVIPFFLLCLLLSGRDIEGFLSTSGSYWSWLFGIAVIMAAFSAFTIASGSYCHLRYAAKNQGAKRIPGYAIGVGVAAVLVLLLPLVAVGIAYSSGEIRDHYGVPHFSATRLDADTISIAFTGYTPAYHPASALDPFLLTGSMAWQPVQDMQHPSDIRILVNGKDASNATAIANSGLNATISPASGLTYAEGSSVTITGKDVRASYGQGTHIALRGSFGNSADMPVYDTTIE